MVIHKEYIYDLWNINLLIGVHMLICVISLYAYITKFKVTESCKPIN